MVDGKEVVIYGVVVTGRDHHTDYITVGSWDFILVEGVLAPVIKEKQYRIQRRSIRTGRFVGKKSRAKTISVRVPVPEREVPTGRYARPTIPVLTFGTLPDDDTIIADTKGIIEDVTGHRMFRTPLQAESGGHNVSIGIQHLTEEQYRSTVTYTYAQYLAELEKRVQREFSLR